MSALEGQRSPRNPRRASTSSGQCYVTDHSGSQFVPFAFYPREFVKALPQGQFGEFQRKEYASPLLPWPSLTVQICRNHSEQQVLMNR